MSMAWYSCVGVVTFLLITTVSSQCTFDAPFASSSWHDNTKGTLTFTDTGMSGWSFTQISGAGTTVVSTWDCLNSTISNVTDDDSYLVFRSKTIFMYPQTTSFVYSYLCMKLTKITDVSYYYYQAYVQDLSVASERLRFSTTNTLPASVVCDPSPSAPVAEYHVLIKTGSEAAASITCPNSLLLSADYTYYDSAETAYCDTTSDKWDVCSNTTEMVFDYTTCTQQIAFSAEGRVWCVANVNNGQYDYVTVYNQDSSLTGTAKRFACISSDGSRASIAPNNCSVSQVPSAIPKQADAKTEYDGAHRVEFDNTYTTCGTTTTSDSLSGGVIAAISIGVIVFVWFWTVLWIVLIGLTVYFIVLMLIIVREALSDDTTHKSTLINGDLIRTPTDVKIDNKFLKQNEQRSNVFSKAITPIKEGFITMTGKTKLSTKQVDDVDQTDKSKEIPVDASGKENGTNEQSTKLPPIRGTPKVHSAKAHLTNKLSPKGEKTKTPLPRENKNKLSPKQGRPTSSSPRRDSSSSKLSPKLSPKRIGLNKLSSQEQTGVKSSQNTSPKQSPKVSPKATHKLGPKPATKEIPKLSPKPTPKDTAKLSPKPIPKNTDKQSPKLSPKAAPPIKPSPRESSQAKLSSKLSPKLPVKTNASKSQRQTDSATVTAKEGKLKKEDSLPIQCSDANTFPKLHRKGSFTTKSPERRPSVSEKSPNERRPSVSEKSPKRSPKMSSKRKPSLSSGETPKAIASPDTVQKGVYSEKISAQLREQSDVDASPKLPPIGRTSRKPSPSARSRPGSTLSKGGRNSKRSPSPHTSPYAALSRKLSPIRRPTSVSSRERSSTRLVTKGAASNSSPKGNKETNVSEQEAAKIHHMPAGKEKDIDVPDVLSTDNIVTAMQINNRQNATEEEAKTDPTSQSIDTGNSVKETTDTELLDPDKNDTTIKPQVHKTTKLKQEPKHAKKDKTHMKLPPITKPRSKEQTVIAKLNKDEDDTKHTEYITEKKSKHTETATKLSVKGKAGTQLIVKDKTATNLPIKYKLDTRFSSKPKIDLKHVLLDTTADTLVQISPDDAKQTKISEIDMKNKPIEKREKEPAKLDKSDSTLTSQYKLEIKITPKELGDSSNTINEKEGIHVADNVESDPTNALNGKSALKRRVKNNTNNIHKDKKKSTLATKNTEDINHAPMDEQHIEFTSEHESDTNITADRENAPMRPPVDETFTNSSVGYEQDADKLSRGEKDTKRSPRDETDSKLTPRDTKDNKLSPGEEKDTKHLPRVAEDTKRSPIGDNGITQSERKVLDIKRSSTGKTDRKSTPMDEKDSKLSPRINEDTLKCLPGGEKDTKLTLTEDKYTKLSPIDGGDEHKRSPRDERDTKLTSRDEKDTMLTLTDEKDTNLTQIDKTDRKIIPRDEQDTQLTLRDEKDTKLTPRDEKDTKLTPRYEKDSDLTLIDERDRKITPIDEQDTKITHIDEKDTELTIRDEQDTKLTSRDEKDRKISPRHEKDTKIKPRDEHDTNLTPRDEKDNEFTPRGEKGTKRTPIDETDTQFTPKGAKDTELTPRDEKETTLTQRDEKDR